MTRSFVPAQGPYDLAAFRAAFADKLDWLGCEHELPQLTDAAEQVRAGQKIAAGGLIGDAFHGLCDEWGYEEPAPMGDRRFRARVAAKLFA